MIKKKHLLLLLLIPLIFLIFKSFIPVKKNNIDFNRLPDFKEDEFIIIPYNDHEKKVNK